MDTSDFLQIAAAIAVSGAAVWALAGARRLAGGLTSPLHRDDRAVAAMSGFRQLVVGLAIAGLIAGLTWDIAWLLWLSVAIGVEELLETSIAVWALRQRPVLEARLRARKGAAGNASL
ncbi:MAG: hypothetical protein WEB00_15820 [Dehalococcoidia bacterium]